MKQFWCKIKKSVIITLIGSGLLGIGYAAKHIILSDTLLVEHTDSIKDLKGGLSELNDKIDNTQPAVIYEKIKNLENNQSRLERKIDFNEQKRREEYNTQQQNQQKMFELLLEIKRK